MSKTEMSTERMLELEDAAEQLRRLEAAGVDNWEGYSIAMEGYTSTAELYDQAREFLESISEYIDVDYPAGHDAGANVMFQNEAIAKVAELLKDATK